MRTSRTGRHTALFAVGSLLIFALPALAQNSGGTTRGASGGRAAAPRNYLPELRTLTETLAKQYNVKIVVDPTLFVAAKPEAPPHDATIESAMDALNAPLKKSAWRRVYLTQSVPVPTADRLASSVRALEKVEQSGLVLENPSTKRATSYAKNFAVTQTFADDLSAQQYSADPIYVLYSTDPAADSASKTPSERFADLQRQQMELMAQMSPQELSQAMSSGMQMMLNMDPQTRAQFMGNMMQATQQMMMNMDPQQRQQLFQSMRQFMPGRPGRPGGGPGGGGF